MNLKSLHDHRSREFEAARQLVDRAEAERRDMTAAENEAFDRHMASIDATDQRIKTIVDAEARDRAIADAVRSLGSPMTETHRSGDVGLRAFLRGETRSYTVNPEARDLTKGTATAGGAAVPTGFYGSLVEHMIQVSPLRGLATVLSTTSGENIPVPTTTAHSTAALTAEAAAIAESDPAFTARTLGAYKYGVMIQVSSELVSDSGIDIAGYLARECGVALGRAASTHFTTGTGTSQPAGIVTGSTLGKTAAATAAITGDELIDLLYSVIGDYRQNATWLVNDTTAAAVRKLKDSTGQYLWQPSLILGQPDLLFGRPVFTSHDMPTLATGQKTVIFGDLSRYFIREVNGIRFERSDEYAFNQDLVTFRAVLRTDGVLVDQTGAVKHLIQA